MKRKNKFSLPLLLLLPAFGMLAYLWSKRTISTYDTKHIQTPCLHVPANREHWAIPDCEGKSRIGETEATLKFNSLGIRDKEYPPYPSRGVLRILILGSSNMLGLGVEEADTVPRQLELRLREQGIQAEVINGAMVGYCTAQTTFRLKELLAAYHPDIVLYQLVHGTCLWFDGAWKDRVVMENGHPTRIDRTPFRQHFSPLNPEIFQRPWLFFLWLTLADQWRKVLFTWKVYRSGEVDNRVKTALEPTLQFLNYIKSASTEAKADLHIFTFKMHMLQQSIPQQMNSTVAAISSRLMAAPFQVGDQKKVFEYLRQNGFSVLVPSFDSKKYQIAGDEHLSAEGDRLFAKMLAEEMLKEPALSKRIHRYKNR